MATTHSALLASRRAPRAVPAADVEHGAPAVWTCKFPYPPNFGLESPVGDAHESDEQSIRQMTRQTRRDCQRAVPFRRSALVRSAVRFTADLRTELRYPGCFWISPHRAPASRNTTRSWLARTTRAPGSLARVARPSLPRPAGGGLSRGPRRPPRSALRPPAAARSAARWRRRSGSAGSTPRSPGSMSSCRPRDRRSR